MEATGIYHLPLAKYLYSKYVSLSVVNPVQVKRFSQMKLQRNKTDKADAKMISLFAQQQEVSQWELSPEILERGRVIVKVTEQYIEFRAGLNNKIDGLKSKKASQTLINSVLHQISHMSELIEHLQKELIDLVKNYDADLLQNITSIVGIGKNTAALLIITTDGFKNFYNAKQLSTYFGLASTENSSGTSVNGKKRISKMGNSMVRKRLYMCSLQGSKYNTACMDLYQRLLVKGKPKKVALIAVVNKLLEIVFAISKSGLPYDREYKSYKKTR